MSGICGWVGISAGDTCAREVAGAMCRALGDIAGREPTLILAARTMIGAQPGIRDACVHRADGLIAAIEGRVRWQSPPLSALSDDRGPAVALAEAYRQHGADCLNQMRGHFAAAVIDGDRDRGMIAIDRVGARTMCFAQVGDIWIFGSNADSVVAHPSIDREMSRQAIFDYLYCHVIPSPGTIYRSVQKLLPGECILFDDRRIVRRFYWQLPYRDDDMVSIADLKGRFARLLRDATRNAIDGDTDVGAFLSGGTDSSTVTGLLTEATRKPARTYSIGFAYKGFDEMDYARITARHFGAEAREYYVTPQDIVEAIPVIARAYDEPFGNDSAAPTYCCAKTAYADGSRILLAGDGGDEIFGGNARYAKQKIFEYYGKIPLPIRRGVIEPLTRLPGAERLPPLRKLGSYVRQASVPLPDRLETYNFLHRSPLSEVFEPDFLASVSEEEPLAMLREVYFRTRSQAAVNRMLHLDLKVTLADNDLRKVTRMCDMAGIEVRYPLLDDALVEFSGEIPPALKVKGLKLRYFFKESLKGFLPPPTIAKTKHGFGMPFGPWLRSYPPLSELVHGSLEKFQHRGILRPSYIEDLRRQHQTGHATYFGIMIWVVAMLECWLDARKL